MIIILYMFIIISSWRRVALQTKALLFPALPFLLFSCELRVALRSCQCKDSPTRREGSREGAAEGRKGVRCIWGPHRGLLGCIHRLE